MKQKIPAMLATLLVSITFFLATGASHTAEAYWEYRVFTDHLCNTRYISYDSRGNQTGMYYSAGSSHNPTIYISSDGYAGNIGVDGSGWNDSPVTGTIAGKTVTLSTTFHANYRGTLSKWVEPPPPPPGYFNVNSISPSSYQRNSPATAYVSVTNTGGQSKSGTVYFYDPQRTQSRYISLSPGQSTTLTFIFLAPGSGSFTLRASADNSISQGCSVTGTPYTPPPDNANGDTITWSETATHQPTYDGIPYTCNHAFTYKAVVTPSLTLTPSTLKSGYGFEVDARGSIVITQIAHGGDCTNWTSRTNTIAPTPPTTAQIKVGWTVNMTMKDKSVKTQPATITLSRKSTTATLYTWEAAQNPISELKLRKIYTNVELTGTKTNPKQHNVTLALTGGGISSRSLGFDKLLVKQITINGDMYEDDHTG